MMSAAETQGLPFPFPTVTYRDCSVVLIDQTRLPDDLIFLTCRDVETVARAIERLQVRGAPAIGLTAAYGALLGARQALDEEAPDFRRSVEAAIVRLRRTRPTAVNLFWALDQMQELLDRFDASTVFHPSLLLSSGVSFSSWAKSSRSES